MHRPSLIALYSGVLLGLLTAWSNAQVLSDWNPAEMSDDWFREVNWSNGVPNASGATAVIHSNGASLNIAENVTLGSLEFHGDGSAQLLGSGGLTFDEPDFGVSSISIFPAKSQRNVTLHTPVSVSGGQTLEVSTSAASTLTLEEEIRAYGGAILKLGEGRLVLLTDSPHWDGALVVAEGTVDVNTPLSLGSPAQGTLVQNGVLNINALTREPLFATGSGRINVNVQQPQLPRLLKADPFEHYPRQTVAVNHNGRYAERVDIVEGALEINADATIGGVEIRQSGRLTIAPDATLRIVSGELRLLTGLVEGSILGPTVLRKITGERAELGAMPQFAGDIRVESGLLRVVALDGLGDNTGATYVTGQDAALQILVDESTTIKEDIFLQNLPAKEYYAALSFEHRSGPYPSVLRLEGRLDLGDRGSTIGGARLSYRPELIVDIAGEVSGGDLTLWGDALRTRFVTANATYSGKTIVRNGTLELAESGRLSATSAIILRADNLLHEVKDDIDGILQIDTSTAGLSDRVADSIPLVFEGGGLRLIGQGVEHFGEMRFMSGASHLESGEGALSTDRITRAKGATATLPVGATVRTREINGEVGGVIPWLRILDDESSFPDSAFGIIVDGSIQSATATDFTNDITLAGPTDNARIRLPVHAYGQNVSVNSLVSSSGWLYLDGGRLTVESGGILFSRRGGILGGELTGGISGGNELVVHGRGTIGASITDNDHGPISVTVDTGWHSNSMYFEGVNSYTGSTYVNEGTLVFTSDDSLPANSDLVVNGAVVRMWFNASEPKHLKEIRVTAGGAIKGTANSAARGIFSFDQMFLEEGWILPGQLVGDGTITKTTPGYASISLAAGSTYSGNVIVKEGRLRAVGMDAANYVVRGGELDIPDSHADVELQGGDFVLSTHDRRLRSYEVNLLVSADSRMVTAGSFILDATFAGVLAGEGDLAIQGRDHYLSGERDPTITFLTPSPDYSGDVSIDTISVGMRGAGTLGSGAVTIRESGRLVLDSRDSDTSNYTNDFQLAGGQLEGTDRSTITHTINGALRVNGDSRISQVTVTGDTHLADGARLTIFGEGLTRLGGTIQVDGYAELQYGSEIPRSNAAGITSQVAQVLGSITPGATESVLNLIDLGLDELKLDASIVTTQGRSLTVLKDGTPLELALHGADKSISGDGVVGNDLVLSGGASLAPGNSAGLLTVDGDVRLLESAVYRVELGGANRGVQYDAVDVAGTLFADGLLDIVLIDGFTPSPDDTFLIAQADEVLGRFANAVDFVQFEGYRGQVSYANEHIVLHNLIQVPEPTAIVLLMLGAIVLLRQKRA